MGLPSLGFIINADIDAAKRALEAVGDLFDSLKENAKATGTTIGAALKDAFTEINKVKSEDAFGAMAIQESAGELQQLGSQVQGIAGQFLDESTQVAGQFEGVFAQIAQKSGAAEEEMQAMREKALELGASTSHSASGVAAVMKDLAADGFSVAEVLEGTDKVLNLATAGEMKAEEAGLYLSDIFAGFKPNLDPLMSTGEAFDYLSDQMAMASDSTSLNVDQVAKTFLKFGPVAADAGLQFSDAAALVGAVSPVAKAEEAGTALKSIVTSARVAASKEVEAMWEEMGYSFEDFVDENGQTDFLGILDFFRQAQLSADQVVAIFGKEFLPVANMLLSDEGFASAAELMETQMGAAGKTAEIAGVNMDGTAGAAASLEGAIETLKIKMGSSGLTDFSQGFETLKAKVVQFVADLPAPMLTTIAMILGLISAIGGLMGAVGAGVATMSSMAVLLPQLKVGFTILRSQAILPLIGAVQTFLTTTLPAALAAAPAALSALGTVLLPLLPWIIAIALAALLIYKYWGPIKAYYQGLFSGLSESFQIFKATVSEIFKETIAPLKELGPAVNQIKQAIASISFAIFGEQFESSGEQARSWGEKVGSIVGMIASVLVIGLIKPIAWGIENVIKFGVFLGEALYAIYAVIVGIASGIRKLFSSIGFYFDVAKDEFGVMVTAVQSWVTLIGSGFRLAGATVKDTLRDAWATISSYGRFVKEGFELMFTSLRLAIADMASLYITPFIDAFASGWNLLKSEVGLYITKIRLAIGDVISAFTSTISQIRAEVGMRMAQARIILQAALDIASALISSVRLVVAEAWYRFSSFTLLFLGTLAQALQAAIAFGQNLLSMIQTRLIQPFTLFLAQLWNGIVSAVTSYIFQPITAALAWLWGTISTALSSYVIQPLIGFFMAIWGEASLRISAVIAGVFDMIQSIGGFVMEGMAGVRSFFGAFFEQIFSGVQALFNLVAEFFEPAVQIFQGFVTSIANKFSQLAQAVSRIAINPFSAGSTGAVATKESRNNAANQAAGTAMDGKVDTATAAGNTTAGVTNTTNANTSNSTSVAVGSVNISAQDGTDAGDRFLNQVDAKIGQAMQ